MSAATGDVLSIGNAMEQPVVLAVDAVDVTNKNQDSSDFDSFAGDLNDEAAVHSTDLELAEQRPQDGSNSTATTDVEANVDLILKLTLLSKQQNLWNGLQKIKIITQTTQRVIVNPLPAWIVVLVLLRRLRKMIRRPWKWPSSKQTI